MERGSVLRVYAGEVAGRPLSRKAHHLHHCLFCREILEGARPLLTERTPVTSFLEPQRPSGDTSQLILKTCSRKTGDLVPLLGASPEKGPDGPSLSECFPTWHPHRTDVDVRLASCAHGHHVKPGAEEHFLLLRLASVCVQVLSFTDKDRWQRALSRMGRLSNMLEALIVLVGSLEKGTSGSVW